MYFERYAVLRTYHGYLFGDTLYRFTLHTVCSVQHINIYKIFTRDLILDVQIFAQPMTFFFTYLYAQFHAMTIYKETCVSKSIKLFF